MLSLEERKRLTLENRKKLDDLDKNNIIKGEGGVALEDLHRNKKPRFRENDNG